MADLIELCTKLESIDYVRESLLRDRNIKEIHVPPRYEMIMRELLSPHYGEVSLSDICLYVDWYVPDNKLYLVYKDGTRGVVDFSN